MHNSKNTEEFKKFNNKINKGLIIIAFGSIYKNDNIYAKKVIFKDYNNKSISWEMISFPNCIILETSIDDLSKVMKIGLKKNHIIYLDI